MMSLTTLREALRAQKLTFGARETLRRVKMGKTKVVFLAKDCRDDVRKTLSYYSTLEKLEIVQMEQGSREIAQLCKKNFPVSVLSY